MRAYWRLPEPLQIAAYCAAAEYAWPREQALLVIQWLTGTGSPVIGVEVWLATEPGPTIPTPLVHTWESDSQRRSETRAAFVQRVNAEAARYVDAFAWHPEDRAHSAEVPYFNLTVSEEHDA